MFARVCGVVAFGFMCAGMALAQEWEVRYVSNLTTSLNDVEYVNDSTLFVVGEFGTILKSTDGGRYWRAVYFDQTLWSVEFRNENVGWTVGFSTILKTTDGGETWTHQSAPNNSYETISFPTDSVGYVVGDGSRVLKTTNAGASWIDVGPTGNERYFTVMFVDAERGWVGGSLTDLLRTEDGGATWQSIDPGISVVNDLFFDDSLTGWATGHRGIILKTVDGGLTWNGDRSQNLPSALSIDFVDDSTGWVVGRNGNIRRTIDAGLTWTFQEPPVRGVLRNIDMLNDSVGVIVGDDGLIFSTTDGGQNWVNQAVSTRGYNSVWFVDELNGYVCGARSTIYWTNTGGDGWTVQYRGDIGTATDIQFQDSLRGCCVTTRGEFLITHDGHTWSANVIDSALSAEAVFPLDSLTYFVCGSEGKVYRTFDAGSRWDLLPQATTQRLNDIYFSDRVHGWAVGYVGTMLLTDDGGNRWQEIPVATSAALTSVHFWNRNLGLVCGQSGTLLRTIDGGYTWGDVSPGNRNYEFNSIRFASETEAWCVGSFHVIMHSTDGGASWSVAAEPPLDLFDLQVIDANRAWAVGANGLVMRYSGTTGVDEDNAQLPRDYSLAVYPNPFNASARVTFSLPFTQPVELTLFDLLGRQAQSLEAGTFAAGMHTVLLDGSGLASGRYFVRLATSASTRLTAVTLLR